MTRAASFAKNQLRSNLTIILTLKHKKEDISSSAKGGYYQNREIVLFWQENI